MINKEIARAYADGKRVQWRRLSSGVTWIDYAESPPGQAPLGDDFYEWRVMPDVSLQYRVALVAPGGIECLRFAQGDFDARAICADASFVRWITDWVPVTVEAEDRS